jgi:alpha-aminoadipate carrier protein LysW
LIHKTIKKGNKMAECPVCGAEIEKVSDTVLGELLECTDCGTELEVTSLDPYKVEEAPQEEEDWGE